MATAPLADWDLAGSVATTVALRGAPQVSRADADALRADLHASVARADPITRQVTGLGGDLPPATSHVVGRRTWVRSNIAALAWLTDPLADKLLRRSGVGRAVARRVLGVQLGVVLGYLSTRVLGQYEVLRPGGQTPGRLLLVGPNILDVERGLLSDTGLQPSEFRFGVILHELAHRVQFEAVPWLRPLLQDLLDEYFEDARLDPERLREIAARLPELLREPGALADPQRILQIVLTPAQARVLARAQAMMSLLEGHGNIVMDWGAEAASNDGGPPLDPARVRTVLNRRRSKITDRMLRSALGLSMKARQYAVGEAFIAAIEQTHGRERFNLVWEDPNNLPTAAELEDPEAWATRVAAGR